MSRKTIYFHHSFLVFAILLFLLVTVVGLVFVGVIGEAFSSIGFTPIVILLILVFTLLGVVVEDVSYLAENVFHSGFVFFD